MATLSIGRFLGFLFFQIESFTLLRRPVGRKKVLYVRRCCSKIDRARKSCRQPIVIVLTSFSSHYNKASFAAMRTFMCRLYDGA
jgi:hypothetical protein